MKPQSGLKPGEKRMLVILVIVVAVAGWLMMSPTGPTGKKLLSAAVARQKYQDADTERARLEKEIEALQPAIDKMAYTEDPDAVVPTVVKTLQEIAAGSGIHLREVKPLRTRRLGAVVKVPLSVRFTTEFPKSIPFLYKVEDPDGRLVVEKVNITAPDPKKPTIEVDAQIALFTRWGVPDTKTTETPASAKL
jgi:Tfp pilus assembly protein PilO